MKLGLELVRAHVDFSAPFCIPYPRVASQRPPHETSVLVCRDTERSLADAPHLEAHRLHRVPQRSAASRTTPAPRRVHRNDARAPRIDTRVASAARSRATSSSARSRRSTSARWMPRSSPSSTTRLGVLFCFFTSLQPRLRFSNKCFFVYSLRSLNSLWTNRTGTVIIGLQATREVFPDDRC
jgi:hypothetical protein